MSLVFTDRNNYKSNTIEEFSLKCLLYLILYTQKCMFVLEFWQVSSDIAQLYYYSKLYCAKIVQPIVQHINNINFYH